MVQPRQSILTLTVHETFLSRSEWTLSGLSQQQQQSIFAKLLINNLAFCIRPISSSTIRYQIVLTYLMIAIDSVSNVVNAKWCHDKWVLISTGYCHLFAAFHKIFTKTEFLKMRNTKSQESRPQPVQSFISNDCTSIKKFVKKVSAFSFQKCRLISISHQLFAI